MSAILYPPGPSQTFPAYYLWNQRLDPIGFLSRLVEKYGDVCHYRSGDQHVYLFNHPDLIKEVLVNQSNNFTKGRTLTTARKFFGSGLFFSDGELHRTQRRLIQPAFRLPKIAEYSSVMIEYGLRAADSWRDGQQLDVMQEMMRVILRIVSKTLFGKDCEDEAEKIRESVNAILAKFDSVTLPFANVLLRIPTPGNLRFQRARRDFDALIYRLMEERRSSGSPSDLLSMLMHAREEDGSGGGMSDVQVRDEVFTFILAGIETTTVALAWTWYLLSQNPQAEQRLHEEVDGALNKESPTFETVEKLPYTRMVIAESMRLYPPPWMISRRAIKDCAIGGYEIPAQAIIIMSQYLMHRDARYYPDPLRFDPLRWTAERQAARPKFCYFPFAGGLRGCIGETFAWTEMVLLLAILSRRWQLRMAPEFSVVPSPQISLRPKRGVLMTAHSRNHKG